MMMSSHPRLALLLLLLAALPGALLAGGCSCMRAKKPDVGFIGLTGEGGGDDLRTESRMGGDARTRPDGRFTGRALSLEQMKALNDAGKRALKDPYFQAAAEAVAAKRYDEAERQIRYAAGNLPNNDYVARYARKVDMYKQSAAADADESLAAARKALSAGMAGSALERAGKLSESPNPFVRRKAHHVRMGALESLGRDDEAAVERLLWLEAKSVIGEMDAQSHAPAVDPAK